MNRAPLAQALHLPVSAFRAVLSLTGAVALAVTASAASAGPPCGNGHSYASSRSGWVLPGASSSVRIDDLMPGLRIALDPMTRRPVTPTPEQRAAGPLAAPQIDEILPVERIPGGGELLHLNGRHQVFEVARRDASGRFRTGCASDSASAARLVATPIPARPREAR